MWCWLKKLEQIQCKQKFTFPNHLHVPLATMFVQANKYPHKANYFLRCTVAALSEFRWPNKRHQPRHKSSSAFFHPTFSVAGKMDAITYVKPARMLRRVLFPAPDGPMITDSSPDLNCPDTPCRISLLSAKKENDGVSVLVGFHILPKRNLDIGLGALTCRWKRSCFLALN